MYLGVSLAKEKTSIFKRCVKLAPQSEVKTKIFTYSEKASFAPPKNPTCHTAPLPKGRYQQKSKKANFTKFTIFSCLI